MAPKKNQEGYTNALFFALVNRILTCGIIETTANSHKKVKKNLKQNKHTKKFQSINEIRYLHTHDLRLSAAKVRYFLLFDFIAYFISINFGAKGKESLCDSNLFVLEFENTLILCVNNKLIFIFISNAIFTIFIEIMNKFDEIMNGSDAILFDDFS